MALIRPSPLPAKTKVIRLRRRWSSKATKIGRRHPSFPECHSFSIRATSEKEVNGFRNAARRLASLQAWSSSA